LQAAQLQVRAVAGHASVDVGDVFEIDPELVLALAGGDLGVGLGVDVRIDAHGDRRLAAQLAGDLVDVAKFGFGLGIQAVDALFKRIGDLLAGLADAGKGALAGIAPSLDDAVEFAAGNDVETAAQSRDGGEHGEVGVGLDRVTDQM